jgi:hypothetical protein
MVNERLSVMGTETLCQKSRACSYIVGKFTYVTSATQFCMQFWGLSKVYRGTQTTGF